jgi:phosphoglycolate phosphatase
MQTIVYGNRLFETELIIFDKDGTLTDFKKAWFPILDKRLEIIIRNLKLKVPERELKDRTYRRFGIRGDEIDPYGPFPYTPPSEDEIIFATVLYELGVPWEKSKVCARESLIEAENEISRIDISLLYEGVRTVLENLKAGNVLMALATADLTDIANDILRKLGILGFFDYVVGADMVVHNKPHPEMIEKTLEALGVSAKKTALVGDSIMDMEMGHRAELGLVVGVTEGGIATEEILSHTADVVIGSVREIKVI